MYSGKLTTHASAILHLENIFNYVKMTMTSALLICLSSGKTVVANVTELDVAVPRPKLYQISV